MSDLTDLVLVVFTHIGIWSFCVILFYFYLRKTCGATKQTVSTVEDSSINVWGIRITSIFFVPSLVLTFVYKDYLILDFDAIWVKIVGIFILFLGDISIFFTLYNLGKNWTMIVSKVEDHKLVTSGSYRCARHPMYTSVIIYACGCFLSTGMWLLFVCFIINYSFAITRICNEERLLISEFGDDYVEYMTQTGAFCPCTLCDCGYHHQYMRKQLNDKQYEDEERKDVYTL